MNGREHAHPVTDRQVAAKRVQSRHRQRERRRPATRAGNARSAQRQASENRHRQPPTNERRLARRRHQLREQRLSGAQLDQPQVSRGEARARREAVGRDHDVATACARSGGDGDVAHRRHRQQQDADQR